MDFEEARKRRTYGRARVPRFLNPLGRISIRSSTFLSFLQWISREMVARSTVKICSEADPLRRMLIRFGGWVFLSFLCFVALDLILALVFPTFVISKYKFLSGALPLETPRAVSAARPHFLIVAPYSQFGP